VAKDLNLQPDEISDNRVSSAWGAQVTEKALEGLGIFLVLVIGYLIIRFELRMAIAAVCSLFLDLILTAGVYSLVGFEVTPSTIIGFLTILGFALYDVVVVFDKVQENTRGITGSSTQTYAEAANLAVNQTLMRSINTGLVALLPVGGLLFIGAGLLKAGTLKDLGLVLFFGMGAAVYSSIFFATPVLVELKSREPRFKAHTQRVLARRASGGKEPKVGRRDDAAGARPAKGKPAPTKRPGAAPVTATDESTELAATTAGSTPRPGNRPGGRPGQAGRSGAKRGGGRGGRPSGKRR
jgi:preprotein translocase subunit SecF